MNTANAFKKALEELKEEDKNLFYDFIEIMSKVVEYEDDYEKEERLFTFKDGSKLFLDSFQDLKVEN